MEVTRKRAQRLKLPSKAFLLAVFVTLLAVPLYGMGIGGGRGEGTSSKVTAAFVDADGTRVEATQVTAAGVAELSGELGRGYLRIPLSSIAKIEFSGKDRTSRNAAIELRESGPVKVKVRGSLTFYGRTPAGIYQIRVRDLQAIEFAE